VMAATAPKAANSLPRRPRLCHDMDFIVPSPAPLTVQFQPEAAQAALV
jgi:hypothetical protein